MVLFSKHDSIFLQHSVIATPFFFFFSWSLSLD